MLCSHCETVNPDDNLFCELCGIRMVDGVAVVESCSCGAPLDQMDADGFCTSCGRRLKRPDSDHIEVSLLPDFAGVSDRGLRHHRNEDRFALSACGDVYALVVCDGVSMSPDADQAASAAVQAVMDSLKAGLADSQINELEVLRKAILDAANGVTELGKGRPEAPSTTLVAAIVKDNLLTVGWIGDSRAYLLAGDLATQITRDHSWQESPAARQPGAEAHRAANAHALTRWVGADAADPEPDLAQQQLSENGLLVLCSDGLWNYAANAQEMGALISRANKPGASALSISRELVEFALSKGGHDNITAVVLRHPISKECLNGG